jgi:nucleotide-binding universal stress UspA family protein
VSPPPGPVQRILVAVDESEPSRWALIQAAELAAELGAELRGIFVEDAEMVRVASLPPTREIARSTAQVREFDPRRVELAWKVQASQLRERVQQEAEPRRVTWSFHVVRGRVSEEVRAAAREADIVLLGSHGQGPRMHPGSTACAVAAGATKTVWLMPRRRGSGTAVSVVYDGTQGGELALQTAVSLAQRRKVPLEVLMPPVGEEEGNQLAQKAGRLSAELGRRARIRMLISDNIEDMEGVIRAEHHGALVLSGHAESLSESALRHLLAHLPCPLLLVR